MTYNHALKPISWSYCFMVVCYGKWRISTFKRGQKNNIYFLCMKRSHFKAQLLQQVYGDTKSPPCCATRALVSPSFCQSPSCVARSSIMLKGNEKRGCFYLCASRSRSHQEPHKTLLMLTEKSLLMKECLSTNMKSSMPRNRISLL